MCAVKCNMEFNCITKIGENLFIASNTCANVIYHYSSNIHTNDQYNGHILSLQFIVAKMLTNVN